MVLIPIYLFLATILFMIQDYAKVHIIHHDSNLITRPIRNAFQFVFKNFRKCMGLYLLNLLTFLAFFGGCQGDITGDRNENQAPDTYTIVDTINRVGDDRFV